MTKEVPVCAYSHDYDGFAFVEDNCACAIVVEDGRYYLCGSCEQRINLNDDTKSGSTEKILLTEAELQLSKKALCQKYCTSHWGKTYDIHNRWESFQDPTPVMELLKKNGL